jgi:hypothetical protein
MERRLYKVKGFAPPSSIPQNINSSQLLELVSIYLFQVKWTLFLGIRALKFDLFIIETKEWLFFGLDFLIKNA